MAGFRRMDEEGRAARRRQGSCHLARDMTALAHTSNCDASVDMQQAVYSFIKSGVQAVRQYTQGVCLLVEDSCRRRDEFALGHTNSLIVETGAYPQVRGRPPDRPGFAGLCLPHV